MGIRILSLSGILRTHIFFSARNKACGTFLNSLQPIYGAFYWIEEDPRRRIINFSSYHRKLRWKDGFRLSRGNQNIIKPVMVWVHLLWHLSHVTNDTKLSLNSCIILRHLFNIYKVCIKPRAKRITSSKTRSLSLKYSFTITINFKLLIRYWCLSRGEGWLSWRKNMSPLAW